MDLTTIRLMEAGQYNEDFPSDHDSRVVSMHEAIMSGDSKITLAVSYFACTEAIDWLSEHRWF
jgi:hypothetical protein